ncbi:tetratricopeptide repeat protein [Magnetovibrio sp. PR-2]|uniref:tetratricopeptide repeat protein n=1 Tax=Magnetovibrio sp. PR-2 TaxID=3120356 RepID=UPI002FCDF15F
MRTYKKCLATVLFAMALTSSPAPSKAEFPLDAFTQTEAEKFYFTGIAHQSQDNPSVAIEWFRKSAELGHSEAQVRLAFAYANGIEVPKDISKAMYWNQKAAEQGHPTAQFNLAVAYDLGTAGFQQNKTKAFEWFSKSAKQGHAKAQCELGNIFSDGKSVSSNTQEALRWYRLSAAQGNAPALKQISLIYEEGKGVLQNYIHAHAWALVAVSLGSPDGYVARKRLSEKMTKEQIAESQKLAPTLLGK